MNNVIENHSLNVVDQRIEKIGERREGRGHRKIHLAGDYFIAAALQACISEIGDDAIQHEDRRTEAIEMFQKISNWIAEIAFEPFQVGQGARIAARAFASEAAGERRKEKLLSGLAFLKHFPGTFSM